MPIHQGKDSKGSFVQWGHQKKYYYKSGNKTSLNRARNKAKKQMIAIYANGYIGQSKFDKLFNKLILQTKQEFSLLSQKEKIIQYLNKILVDLQSGKYTKQQLVDDYQFEISRQIYFALRHKNNIDINLENEQITFDDLFNFTNNVTKDTKSFDDIGDIWVIYKYNFDPQMDEYTFIRKTYSRYITINIQYTKDDLNILENALIQLKNIAKSIAEQNKIFIGLKYHHDFTLYFKQNDNIKLYCIKKEDFKYLLQIESQFLNLLKNKENNRIYKNGIDDGFSFGQKLSRKIAQNLIQYMLENNKSSQQTFDWLYSNFEQIIKCNMSNQQ